MEENWTVLDFGPEESDGWTLVDPTGSGDYVFLAGDLDGTYTDFMETVAISPLIDLSAQSTDQAFYLTFDFASALELCCDPVPAGHLRGTEACSRW